MNSPAYFTLEALERLRLRLAEALTAYKAVCDSNPDAAEAGDNSVWHDNFAFEENQRHMHMLACRVRELDLLLKRAVLVTPPQAPTEVCVGCRVSWRFDDEPTVRSCELASFDDGDSRVGRVSYNSPLGRGLLSAREGDVVEVNLAGRQRLVNVIRISVAEGTACAA